MLDNPRPCNRHLLLEICTGEDQEEERSGILLPEDYVSKSPFGKAKVIGMSSDCSLDVLVGECVIYNNSMLEEVQIDGQTYSMILENYVLCVV
tara:strand:+ start:692 stop:970 length:279 start_codon:yes stop_codon:yes gene_type:complete